LNRLKTLIRVKVVEVFSTSRNKVQDKIYLFITLPSLIKGKVISKKKPHTD
jgi:hypothetical protein